MGSGCARVREYPVRFNKRIVPAAVNQPFSFASCVSFPRFDQCGRLHLQDEQYFVEDRLLLHRELQVWLSRYQSRQDELHGRTDGKPLQGVCEYLLCENAQHHQLHHELCGYRKHQLALRNLLLLCRYSQCRQCEGLFGGLHRCLQLISALPFGYLSERHRVQDSQC